MHTESLVIICPAEHLDFMSGVSAQFGHTANELSVPLYTGESVTHYGLHAWATPETVNAWLYAESLPIATAEELAYIRSILTISARTGGVPSQHFADVIAGLGLTNEVAD